MSIAWRRPWFLALAGLAAAVLLLLWGLREPAPVLQGWLIAFAFWSGVAIGGLVLLLIHALTGGRWGEAIAPVLEPAARTLPLFVLLVVPLALGLRHLYPWAVAWFSAASASWNAAAAQRFISAWLTGSLQPAARTPLPPAAASMAARTSVERMVAEAQAARAARTASTSSANPKPPSARAR